MSANSFKSKIIDNSPQQSAMDSKCDITGVRCIDCPVYIEGVCYVENAKEMINIINSYRAGIKLLEHELDEMRSAKNQAVAERELYLYRLSNLEEQSNKQQAIIEAIDAEMLPVPFETDFDRAVRAAKHEAIKEFAEKLKESVKSQNSFDFEDVDNLVKQTMEVD